MGQYAGQACARLAGVSRIVYVSGRPGAGKSSLAFPLAAELGYSLVTKDLVKEALHDALHVPGEGEVDLAWSRQLGGASFALLWTLAARAGDMVIEANFHPDNIGSGPAARPGRPRWSRCTARAPPRSPAPATTPGRGTRSTGDAAAVLDGKYDRPVGVGPLITVDTTGPVDVAAVAAEVRRLHAPRYTKFRFSTAPANVETLQ